LNVNKIAGSTLGLKYSEESKEKMSIAKKGSNHPLFGKTHSKETKEKMSVIKKNKIHSEESKLKMSQTKGTTIYVYSLQFELLFTFPSSRAAAKHFNCADTTDAP